jgi:hypothetical protein
MGFAQQCGLVGSVQICVFGDEVQGKGNPSPASAMEKPGSHLLGGDNGTHTLCEWLRMKFSAGFLQWEPSEASRGYEFNRPTRDVLNQNLELRDALFAS